MEKIARKHVLSVIEGLLETQSYKAEKYINEKLVIRATRIVYGKKMSKTHNVEVILVIGKPNYKQRAFIKSMKKNKVTFKGLGVMITGLPKKK